MNRKIMFLCFVMSAVLFLAACNTETPADGGNNTGGTQTQTDGNDGATTGNDPAPVTGDEIRIGIIAPLTGEVAIYGIASSNGSELAFSEVNAAGGVLGSQIRVFKHDDEHNPVTSVSVFQRLVNQENVVAIVGPVTSGPANAVGAAAALDDAIPLISPTGTHEDVTSHGDFAFRACFLDNFQARSMGKFAVEQLEASTAAVLFNSGSAYSEGLADNFRQQFEAMGGTIVAFEAYSDGDVDFRTQLTNINARNADVLFLPDYYSTVANIATQVRELGVTAVMLGADGWEGIFDVLDDPSIMNGSFYSAHFASDDPDPMVQSFITNYTAEFGMAPSSFAALGYDAALIIAQAISEAGSTDSAAIINALQNINFSGVTGNVTFDPNGDPIKDLMVITIETADSGTIARFYSRVSP
ncbi:MAG: ABC transporter substrate-binding protein [Clostridiales bacterium]|jgi:branched-chain amino acid transport system substrate-binding protein|nr:ABC transporter substrate-binding protein [Clostridiales bacterium]